MRIVLIVGLPGSGKSHFLKTAEGTILDDLTSLDDLPETFETLWIADANLCRAAVRDRAKTILAERYPGATLEWMFYANDPEQCRINVVGRDGRNVLPDIAALSRDYVVPAGQVAVCVWKPE